MPDARRTSSPQSSSVLEDLRALQDRVRERILELEPYAQELAELREQADRLGIDLSRSPRQRRAAQTAAKPARAARRSTAKPRRRRRSSSGQSRADQVLALVQEQPGITIPALGEALGVDSTGLYRVARNLEADGHIRKEGRQLQPVAQPQAAQADGIEPASV